VPSPQADEEAARLKSLNSSPELLQAAKRAYDEYLAHIPQCRASIESEQLQHQAQEPGDDLVVTTLGTGSAMPSKYRNGKSYPSVSLASISNVG
jgi:vacuolar-type H+-ATPase subunit E/Vma4